MCGVAARVCGDGTAIAAMVPWRSSGPLAGCGVSVLSRRRARPESMRLVQWQLAVCWFMLPVHACLIHVQNKASALQGRSRAKQRRHGLDRSICVAC